jgi:hypothetical protein
MHGSDRVPDLRDYKRAWVGKGKPFNESEMALFSECSLECARKVLDTADIVREAMFRELRVSPITVRQSCCLVPTPQT